MFKHYLASALRHFAKHKTTTIINVLCLSLGLICFAIAYGITEYYLKADLYHEKGSRTYVVTQRNQRIDASTSTVTLPFSGLSVASHLRSDYPALELVARATTSQEIAIATGGEKTYALVSFADQEYLEVFDLPFIAGDRRAALRAPRSAVIKDDFAQRLFGTNDVVGKTLLLNNRETVRIAGVIGAPRQPTHIAAKFATNMVNFSMLVSMDTGDALRTSLDAPAELAVNRSYDPTTFTYVVFRPDSTLTPDQMRADLLSFSRRHVPATRGSIVLGLRPVSELLDILSDAVMGAGAIGLSSRAMLLILGAMVLAGACLNYANLASAQATTRLKELAMRRVIGAGRGQIIAQSLFEAALLVCVAAAMALALLPVVAKSLRDFSSMDIGPLLHSSLSFWGWMVAALVIVSLLACSYPAAVAARIRPADALQRGHAPTSKRRAMYCLVVVQFAVASFLFVATNVMQAQNERMRPALTEDHDPIAVISNNTKEAGVDIQVLQNELRRQSSIKHVSAIDTTPGVFIGYRSARMLSSADPQAKRWRNVSPSVDHDFFATANIRLLAGREFDRNNFADMNTLRNTGNVVIDRALAEEYGWQDPQLAVGKQVFVASSGAKDAVSIPRTVIGVVENKMLVPMVFDSSSSTIYSLDQSRATIVLVRLTGNDVADGLRAIERVWDSLAPNIPLKQRFLDEQFDTTYKWITDMLSLFRILAFMTMVVGTLGLLGIATHAMNQRRFEIGVRRTLGASVRQVLFMLLKDFGKPIAIANLLAWPLAFVVARGYTSMFADKAPVTIAPFIVSLLLGLTIAWLAVLRQATSAARMNPATVLRHE